MKILFEDLVHSSRLLLERFKLPPDGGAAIVQARTDGTAVTVSDGSYDKSR